MLWFYYEFLGWWSESQNPEIGPSLSCQCANPSPPVHEDYKTKTEEHAPTTAFYSPNECRNVHDKVWFTEKGFL